MLVLLKLWKIGLGLLAGLAIGWFVMAPAAHEQGRASGYESGHAAGEGEERAVWQQRQREAEAKADADRRAAQAQIDAVEEAYHQRDQARRADMAELERALQDAETDVPIPTASPGAPPVCRPAVPRRLRDALSSVGAPAARRDPAGAAAPVRGPR